MRALLRPAYPPCSTPYWMASRHSCGCVRLRACRAAWRAYYCDVMCSTEYRTCTTTNVERLPHHEDTAMPDDSELPDSDTVYAMPGSLGATGLLSRWNWLVSVARLCAHEAEDRDRLAVALQLVAARQAEQPRPLAVGDVQRVPLGRLQKPARHGEFADRWTRCLASVRRRRAEQLSHQSQLCQSR